MTYELLSTLIWPPGWMKNEPLKSILKSIYSIAFEKLKNGTWPFVFVLLTEILQMNNSAPCMTFQDEMEFYETTVALVVDADQDTWGSGCYDSFGVFVWANLCSASELSWKVYWLFWVHSSSVAKARRWEKATKSKIADTKKWACVADVCFSLVSIFVLFQISVNGFNSFICLG